MRTRVENRQNVPKCTSPMKDPECIAYLQVPRRAHKWVHNILHMLDSYKESYSYSYSSEFKRVATSSLLIFYENKTHWSQ